MSKTNMSLSKDEIEEELVNNDLINSGGVENEIVLNEMNLEEKKDLLRGIKQSKEEFHNESSSSPLSNSELETSTSSFPSLPVAGKNHSGNKLKLPRKLPPTSKTVDSQDSLEKASSLEDVVHRKFNLPFCIDDGELPLPMPERPTRLLRNTYYVMKGENATAALRRMIADHESWKAAYTAETSRLESHALGRDIEESDSMEQRNSPKHGRDEDEENDPYHFVSKSPIHITKVYSGPRKREPNTSSNEVVPHNSRPSRQLQRKASRDSDCEEVEPILKPEEAKMGEWIQAARPKSKRNRKQLINQEKGRPKSVEDNTEVAFEFRNKWDDQSSTWRGPQSPSLGSLNNQIQTRRGLTNTPEVEEKAVECPICQKRFPRSKVENHAALCEGFSDSPMDVEEN